MYWFNFRQDVSLFMWDKFDINLDRVLFPISEYHAKKNIRKFPIGSVIQGCNLHVGMVTDNDGYDVKFTSLLDGKQYGCSIYHCGVHTPEPTLVIESLRIWPEGGERELLILNGGYTAEEVDEFMKEWR